MFRSRLLAATLPAALIAALVLAASAVGAAETGGSSFSDPFIDSVDDSRSCLGAGAVGTISVKDRSRGCGSPRR